MCDCDLSFDECIELCTEPLFEETTLEEAMRERHTLSPILLRTYQHFLKNVSEPSVVKTEDDPEVPELSLPSIDVKGSEDKVK